MHGFTGGVACARPHAAMMAPQCIRPSVAINEPIMVAIGPDA